MEQRKFNPPPIVHAAMLIGIAIALAILIAVPWNAINGYGYGGG